MKGFCLADGGLSQRWTAQYQRCPGHSWLARRWEQLIRPRLSDDAGELCLARLKSGETLMEDRSDSDVQIDRRSWV